MVSSITPTFIVSVSCARLKVSNLRGKDETIRAFRFNVFIIEHPIAARAENPDKKLIHAMRTALEGQTRQEFEEAKENALVEAKKRHPEGVSPKDWNDVVDALKMVGYNKAYIYYLCLISLRRTVIEERISECVKEPLAEATATTNFVMKYLPVIEGNPKALNCEIEARLFKEEVYFPPYDFLAGPATHLIDHKKWRDCIVSRL